MNSQVDTRMCTRCIMRLIDDPEITFTGGVCNHCLRYDELIDSRVLIGDEGNAAITRLAHQIKKTGRRGEYDCLIGVSGGIDSTYVAMSVKRLGLRPLAVHVDNGWNSETAVKNIEQTLEKLDIDLETHVLRLDEFYDLQRSFLLASTPDGEIPSDHAIQATLWKVARKHGIRYIVSGMNFRTEAMSVPSWAYGHSDWRYIKDVHRNHGNVKLRSYPHFGFLELLYTTVVRRVRIVSVLNYVDYDKAAAVQEMSTGFGWRDPGGKHFESVYTRFYQAFVLPVKFGIDKRRGHLSDLINSGLTTRDAALIEIESTDYSEELARRDRTFVEKKLRLTTEEFDAILAAPRQSFHDYRNSYGFVQFLRRSVNRLRRLGLYPR